MTEQEMQLLTIIRDPAALMLAAAQAITSCLRPPERSESPCLADPASADETD